MSKRKLHIIAGTRPNFIKITQFKQLSGQYNIDTKIIHTGQHFDEQMSKVFCRQFALDLDYTIQLAAASPVAQIAEMMTGLEQIFLQDLPEFVMVVGDVNSTLAAAIVANKMNLRLMHLESGLRSFDTRMPEEWNRIVTDQLSEYLFVTEESGIKNLLEEGKQEQQIFFSGNTMIDTLMFYDDKIQNDTILELLGIESKEFILMTMHRPGTVDSNEGVKKLLGLLKEISYENKIVFPVHPRTLKQIKNFGLWSELESIKNIIIAQPLGYFAFQKLIYSCKLVITDSGGIQEETTFRGIPCLTLRPNTERPVTISTGTNTLVDFDVLKILGYIQSIDHGTYKKGNIPALWDGKSTKRILKFINSI